ncbi:Bikaverin cluster transcription factor bik5 [Fusarium oxysporum f. sp. cubense]|uniref:Bikaverin cluster transcription factor bik5 n=1 Tax=Fusarium oxysporum f. sp. cubense TaxID=61366 RepID=A0A559LSS7_FUSOC|nr:Bikaverin cluster transcription factor bik5 [Fusarium oxysporum f. sp. cubense]
MKESEVQPPLFAAAAAAAATINNTPFAPIPLSLHNKVSYTIGHHSSVSSLRPQSCFLCRRRKVRCNKESPCSTCRRVQVPCIYPVGRAPRQTRIRRHGAQSIAENELAEKVSVLEQMIEKLGDRINGEPTLKSAVSSTPSHTASQTQTCTPKDSPSHSSSPETHCQELSRDNLTSDQGHSLQSHELQHKLGRLVLHEETGSKRYVCDGIWAKLDEEWTSIREESPNNPDDACSSNEDDNVTLRASSSAHSPFFFGYLPFDSVPAIYHPESTQVPYLWSIYQENVEPLLKAVHVPTMEKVFHDAKTRFDQLSTAYQALIRAIYYAAVVSLDPEDVLSNLGQSKDEALARYRFATEQALSRVDFLVTSDITVLQALSIFLAVVRHEGESRLCWSLTGLAIHLARGMGLHRDGSQLALRPFEKELRRRLWWALLQLDIRSAEELGTDLIVGKSTFDTQMPSNLNDKDISPDLVDSPTPREGRTDMTLLLVRCEICKLSRQVIEAVSTVATVEEQKTMLLEVYKRVDEKFFKWIDKTDPLYDMAAMLARSLRAKIYFVIYHPALFPATDVQSQLFDEARQCVYRAAVNILEYDHRLHVDPKVQQYRWLFQTFTNWHAIAYFLIESCRRPWTPLVERGWQAVRAYQQRDPRYLETRAYHSVVLPVKKLWLRANKHRDREIVRLREDLEEANHLEHAERMAAIVLPFGDQFGGDDEMMDLFRAKWNALIMGGNSNTPFQGVQPPCLSSSVPSSSPTWSHESSKHQTDTNPEFFRTAMSLSDTSAWQPSEKPMDLSMFGVGSGYTGLNDNEMQAQGVGTDSMHDSPSMHHTKLPSWLSLSPTANTSVEELEFADVGMFGDEFNWQDWAINIKGLGLS